MVARTRSGGISITDNISRPYNLAVINCGVLEMPITGFEVSLGCRVFEQNIHTLTPIFINLILSHAFYNSSSINYRIEVNRFSSPSSEVFSVVAFHSDKEVKIHIRNGTSQTCLSDDFSSIGFNTASVGSEALV